MNFLLPTYALSICLKWPFKIIGFVNPQQGFNISCLKNIWKYLLLSMPFKTYEYIQYQVSWNLRHNFDLKQRFKFLKYGIITAKANVSMDTNIPISYWSRRTYVQFHSENIHWHLREYCFSSQKNSSLSNSPPQKTANRGKETKNGFRQTKYMR